jgi:HD domain-containing protein
MKRRDLIKGLGAVALSGSLSALDPYPQSPSRSSESSDDSISSAALPKVVAGIPLVDSKIAMEATKLAQEVSPPFLFNHAVRTFLFGALTGRASGVKMDHELLYLACILHDIGLTERFAGDLPFEIQGAQAASRFLEEHGLAKERTAIVWDGIAMHALAIGEFKQPEIALVGAGAGADVVGPDFSIIKKAELREVVRAFPRLGFKDHFVKTCANVVRQHPSGASRGFMRDIGERYVPNFHPRNICDAITQSPFSE